MWQLMIIVSEDSILQATKVAYLTLYNGSANESDPTILREDAATISIANPAADEQPFALQDGAIRYTGCYPRYFPFMDVEFVPREETYFSNAFLVTKELDGIIKLLQTNPASRRALISTWGPDHRAAAKGGAACVTQLYFRMRSNSLHLHSHSRANDAYRLLLLDMQFVTWVQQEIARKLEVKVGPMVHFVDSLHLYVKHSAEVEKQKEFMMNSPEWRLPSFRL
jgi:Thymidylate synthase